MKKTLFSLSLAACVLITLTGCSIFTNKGKAAKAEEKGRAAIVNIETRQSANNIDKIDTIAGLAFGTDYALSKVNEPPREVTVARDMNKRVMSLSGSPTLDKMKEMQDTIDKLTSTIEKERAAGKAIIDEKDIEISSIQAESKVLSLAKDTEIHKYMLAAQQAAAAADSYKEDLDKMNSWLGLGAVWYGLKKFIFSSLWIFGTLGIIFLVLRIAASSNPICGAIFGIVEQIVAWFINAIKVIFPKALGFAGQVSTEVYAASQNLLKKIIDNVQNLKQLETKLGHDITLKELFVELDKSMNDDEKKVIADIKNKLGY